jgi:glycosyltransferase involved in cell wall biosynthesis
MDRLTFSHRIDLWLQKAWTAWAARKKTAAVGQVSGILLAESPDAFAVWDYVFADTVMNRPDFWVRWKGKPLLVVVMRTWETGERRHIEHLIGAQSHHKKQFPGHRVVFAANANCELAVFVAAGLEAIWCNHNAHVMERAFQPHPGAKAGDEREFAAIYDARFKRYKRHQLAAKVRSLALIHYSTPGLVECLWELKTRRVLSHARILNRHRRWFWPVWMLTAEVELSYNRARVGLCLSGEEGAMLASIQYLLCGLPVVTTPSRGGRDDFFDEENSLVVAAKPEAVAAGVLTMIDRRVDPWVIRAKTLERMAEHRARLVALVEEFQRQHGVHEERLMSRVEPRRMQNGFNDRLG